MLMWACDQWQRQQQRGLNCWNITPHTRDAGTSRFKTDGWPLPICNGVGSQFVRCN